MKKQVNVFADILYLIKSVKILLHQIINIKVMNVFHSLFYTY